MPKLVLKCEKLLGGVKLPAGQLLAFVEPTEPLPLADVRLCVQLGIVDTEPGALILTRTKVLSGQTCVDGHRLATVELADGISAPDVKLVLLTGEYEFVESQGEAVEGAVVEPSRGEIEPSDGEGEMAEAPLVDGVESAQPRRRTRS